MKQLWIVAPTGGVPQHLGVVRPGVQRNVPGIAVPLEQPLPSILDERNGLVLAVDADDTIRLRRSANEPVIVVTEFGIDAKLLPDNRVVFAHVVPSETDSCDSVPLAVWNEAATTMLEPDIEGPFGLEPELNRWYVFSESNGSGSRLVRDVVP